MFFILLGIVMFLKLVQLSAMRYGTAVNDDGIYIADNPVLLENRPSPAITPMLMLLGSLNSFTPVQSANTYEPDLVNDVKPVFLRSCIPVSPVQYRNADPSSVFILAGKDDKLVMPAQ